MRVREHVPQGTAHTQVYGHFTFSAFLTLERKSGSDLGRHGDLEDVTLRRISPAPEHFERGTFDYAPVHYGNYTTKLTKKCDRRENASFINFDS